MQPQTSKKISNIVGGGAWTIAIVTKSNWTTTFPNNACSIILAFNHLM